MFVPSSRIWSALCAMVVLPVGLGSCARSDAARVELSSLASSLPPPASAPEHAPPAAAPDFHALAESVGPVIGGIPKSDQPCTVLINIGYVSCYSEETRTPLWVYYRLSGDDEHEVEDRKDYFAKDERIPDPVGKYDYRNSGYDRGHMAPNKAMAQRYGLDAQVESFLMTNIVPQVPQLNSRGWAALEILVNGTWAEEFKEVWVFVGPVFEDSCEEIVKDVRIPDATFMIICDIHEVTGAMSALGVVTPQDRIDYQPISDFDHTIREIEEQTGIDFFPDLSQSDQDLFEIAPAAAQWNTAQKLVPPNPAWGAPRPIVKRNCD